MSTLNALSQAIGSITAAHGDDVCLAYCDAVYREVFKSPESFTYQNMGNPDSDQFNSLVDLAARYLAIKAGHDVCSVGDEFHDMEIWDVINTFRNEAQELVMNGLEFVDIVNYKGEGEGYEVKDLCASLRTFRGKYNYE